MLSVFFLTKQEKQLLTNNLSLKQFGPASKSGAGLFHFLDKFISLFVL